MSKELNIKLKDTVSNYQDKDLSLKVFMRGSLVLDIKIGGDWVYPDNYSVPYTDGECNVVIQKEGRNGRIEGVLANEFPTWDGKFMSASIVDSDEEFVRFEPTDVEQISIPSVAVPTTLYEVDDCCGDPEDCVDGDEGDCEKDTDKE